MRDKGKQRETKLNHLSPASRHAMRDKGKQRETKQNHLSPASRHVMGGKGGKGEQGDTRKGKGRQGETKVDKGNKAKSSQPSTKTGGDKERQSKVIPAQHPDDK